MKRPLSLLTTWSAIAVALVALLVTSSDTAEADFFEPCSTVHVVNPAPDVTSDLTGSFGIGIGADCVSRTGDDDNVMYNIGATINFTPPEWGVAADLDIPDGVKVAELDAEATLGLLNNPCKDKVFPSFEMLDGTTDSGNPVSPLPPGTPDRLAPLVETGGTGIIVGAEKFPHFLGPISPSNPDAIFRAETLSNLRARLFGATTVAGIQVILNFMIFEPGTTLSVRDLDFATDPALGYPSVTVLQDPTAPASNQDAITDFCSPLATSTSALGKVGNAAFRTNPSDGAYNFMTFVTSQFDADEDGIENLLDPCPFDRDDQYGPNGDIAWDPRGAKNQDPGDRDVDPDFGVPFSDGIPDSCDPFPDVPSIHTSGIGIARTDEDGDGWANRVDNCPLIANVDQENADSDAIGDACDPNPTVNDGHQHIACLISTVNIGAGGTAPYTNADLICNENAVGIDKNGNGIFDSQEGGGGTDGTGGTGVAGEVTGPTEEQLATAVETTTKALFTALDETLSIGEVGLLIDPAEGFDTTSTGTSAPLVVVCAEKKQSGLEPVSGEEITFKIDSQPGSDASLEDETATTDDEGSAVVTLNVGSTAGDIVVSSSSENCGTDTTTVAVVAAGPDTGVGSLAPIAASIPTWAAIASAFGGAGLLGSLGAIVSRILRRRHQ